MRPTRSLFTLRSRRRRRPRKTRFRLVALLGRTGFEPAGLQCEVSAFYVIASSSPKLSWRTWNKIEHRLFSHITQNWRGRPLVSREAVVALIRSTKTKTGLRVRSRLDTRRYAVGQDVPVEALKRVRITPHRFHGEWNYAVRPDQTER